MIGQSSPLLSTMIVLCTRADIDFRCPFLKFALCAHAQRDGRRLSCRYSSARSIAVHGGAHSFLRHFYLRLNVHTCNVYY